MEIFTEDHYIPVPELSKAHLELLNKIATALLMGKKSTSLKAMRKFEEEVPEAKKFFFSGINGAKVLHPEAWNTLAFEVTPPEGYMQEANMDFDAYLPTIKEVCNNLESCGSPCFTEAVLFAAEGVLFAEIANYLEEQYYKTRYVLGAEMAAYQKAKAELAVTFEDPTLHEHRNYVVKGDIKRLTEILLSFWDGNAIELKSPMTFLDFMLYERHLIHIQTDEESQKIYLLPDLSAFSYLRAEKIKLDIQLAVFKPERAFKILHHKYDKYGVYRMRHYDFTGNDPDKRIVGKLQRIQLFNYFEMLNYWDLPDNKPVISK